MKSLPLWKLDIIIEKQMKNIKMKDNHFKCEHQLSAIESKIENLNINKQNLNKEIEVIKSKEDHDMKLHQKVLYKLLNEKNKSILRKHNSENIDSSNDELARPMTIDDELEFDKKWRSIDEYKMKINTEYEDKVSKCREATKKVGFNI